MRLLYLTRENHPSTRPDLAVLFGRELHKQGIETHLVANGDPACRWPAGPATIEPAAGGASRLLSAFRTLFRLGSLAKGPVDAIQTRDRFFGALWALLVARRSGKPFFYWMSLPFPEAWLQIGRDAGPTRKGVRGWAYRLRWWLRGAFAHLVLYRWVLPRADHVFAQSSAMADALERHGVERSRLTPVPMGVDMAEMSKVAASPDDPRVAGRRYVVYLGALERARQPELLIDAFAIVHRADPEIRLVLAGDSQDPADRSWLEGLIRAQGLESHVVITGWLPPQQARAYVRGGLVAWATCPRGVVYDMASPTKVAEYLALGVPVIANDQPDQVFVLQQTRGGLCVPFTAEAFADATLQLLDDPDRARAMGQEGQRRIGALRGYDVIAAELAACYRSVKPQGQPMLARR
jgi:glycosyltransferase involved in cell wall biosynthesis